MKVAVQVVKTEDVKVEISPEKMLNEICADSREMKELRPSSITLMIKSKVLAELGCRFDRLDKIWDIRLSEKGGYLEEEVEYRGSHSWYSSEKIRDLTPEEIEFYKAYQAFDEAYCKFRLAQDNNNSR